MTTNDEMLIRSLAALGENRIEDPAVEQHLAEFQAAYAELDTDPTTADQLDAMVAEVVLELDDTHGVPGMGTVIAQHGSSAVHQTDVLAELQRLDARLDQLQESRTHRTKPLGRMRSVAPEIAAVTSVLMVVAVVILALFGPSVVLSAPLTAFSAAPAAMVLSSVYAYYMLVRTSISGDHDRADAAYRTLRLLRGGIEAELRDIEARERVATAASRSTSTTWLTLELDQDGVKVSRRH